MLYVGALLGELDVWDNTVGFLKGVAGAAMFAVVLASVGLAIAAWTPRRGIGVAAIVTVLTLLGGISAIISGIADEQDHETLAGWAGLISPIAIVDGVQVWLLNSSTLARHRAARRRGRTGLRPRRGGPRRRLLPAARAAVPGGDRLVSVITLATVSRWYGDVVAVNDVTMTIGPGVTGLLGPNGAGKSTLISMMAGFLAPSAGTVELDGERGVAPRAGLPADRHRPRDRGGLRRRDGRRPSSSPTPGCTGWPSPGPQPSERSSWST